MAVQILQQGGLEEPYELVVDQAVLDAVELVDVLHNCLTYMLDKVLDKSIIAYGNSKTNVTVNYKVHGGEQGTECAREGSAASMRCAASCAPAAEIPLTRSLVFPKLRSRSASSLNTCLISKRTSRATLSFTLM
jgi:hypothetical protein